MISLIFVLAILALAALKLPALAGTLALVLICYEAGRWCRREVVYLHLPRHVDRADAVASAASIRKGYRDAGLRTPIILTVPSGYAVTRKPNG